MIFTILGFALGLTTGYLLWCGDKDQVDMLQWYLERCKERIIELGGPLPTSKPIDGNSPFKEKSDK